MTAQVLLDQFTHQNNQRDVAQQEYELAKAHFNAVARYRDPCNPEHNRRFNDALERKRVARERFVEMLCGQ